MRHSPHTIDRCKELLYIDYSPEIFEFHREKGLPGGNGAMPDIQVLRDGKPVCVVEIAYTKPDKIKTYRELGIPDIRWYSSKLELIEQWHYPYEIGVFAQQLIQKRKEINQEIGHIVGRLDHLLTMDSTCSLCEDNNVNEKNQECSDTIYFNHTGYQITQECGYHDDIMYEKSWSWIDPDGPFFGQQKELLEIEIEQKLQFKFGADKLFKILYRDLFPD